MTSLPDKAALLKSLHRKGDPVVLPTVWDAWSANFALEAGFVALTIGSHPAADSLGKADGEGMTFDEYLGRVKEITAAVDAPISVDIESGYGESPERLVNGLLEAGAVGFNIEDTVHSEGKRLRSATEHADLIAALRAASDATDTHIVINARTDWFKDKHGSLEEGISRMKLCAEAGADSMYPVGFHDQDTYRRLADELPLPVNGIAKPSDANLAWFAEAGVGRISFGPILQMELGARAAELLGPWKK